MTSPSGRKTHEIIQLLISPRRILLIILWHAHHLRYRHSIDLAERLYQTEVSEYTPVKQIVPLSPMMSNRTHLPPPHIPRKTPAPEHPRLSIMHPPPGIEYLIDTHILN